MANNLQTLFPQIISNTDLSLISQCQFKWFRTRVQHLKKNVSSYNADLEAGGAYAYATQRVREAFYDKGKSAEEALEIGKFFLKERMEKEANGYDIDSELKNPQRMCTALEAYFKKWPLEEEEFIPLQRIDGTYAIEQSLTAQLSVIHPETGKPLIFKGKLDNFPKRNDRIYIMDEKTTKNIRYNEAQLRQASGQFLGYAWLAKQHGIEVTDTRVRLIAIQQREIKLEEFIIPATPFAVNRWYNSTVNKLTVLSNKYKAYLDTAKSANSFVDETLFFDPDYEIGCTSYNKPCQFIESCTLETDNEALQETNLGILGLSQFTQNSWDSETRTVISLKDLRIKLGLEG